MIINGKKVLSGGTFAVSAAALAVGSVALATQPKIPETSMVEKEPIVIPVPSVNTEELKEQNRKISEAKEMADEAFNEANRATFEVRTITEQMNTNIEIYNDGFKTLVKELEQTLKDLGDINKKFKDWKEGTEDSFKEVKEEYKELKDLGQRWREIKEPSDIGTMEDWVTKRLEKHIQERVDIKRAFDKVLEEFKGLKQDVEFLTDELDDLRIETTGN